VQVGTVFLAAVVCFLGGFWVGTHPNTHHQTLSLGVSIVLYVAGALFAASLFNRWKKR
jgi:hypothetical protein